MCRSCLRMLFFAIGKLWGAWAMSLNLIASLALYQHRRDVALGMTHLTTKQRGLLWYYQMKQQEMIKEFTGAAMAKSLVDQIDRRMAEIMQEAQTAPLERKRVLLLEAIELKKQAHRIVKRG